MKSVKFQREEEADPKQSDVVETAGWGSLNNLGGRPDKLQELSITVKSRSECGRGDYYGLKFTSNMLCAAERRKDTCDVSFTAMVHKVLHDCYRWKQTRIYYLSRLRCLSLQ